MPLPPPQPPQELTEGDLGFTGLNELTQPAQLQAGDVAEALNVRFTNNKAECRLGVAKLAWTNRVNSTSTAPQPFNTIYGGVDFRDPDDVEWTIIAADGGVFRTRESMGATRVPLPAGVEINTPVTFAQCFNGLVMFRGEKLPELIMPDIDTGFIEVSQAANVISGTGTANPTDGTRPIPFANNGEWIGNRLFIPTGDFLEISDYLNPTRYAGVREQARINQGSEDKLVRFFKFNDNAGIAFKSASIYVLNGITGDLSTMSLDGLTAEYGLAAAKSCVNVGTDVWFLAQKRGICSITQTEFNKIQGTDVPVSLRIKALIDRINWKYAGNAVAAYYENKYYLSVPLDDATCLGPELVPTGAVYDGVGHYTLLGFTPGYAYQWTPGLNDFKLYGSSVLGNAIAVDAETFVAAEIVVHAVGEPGMPVTASIRRALAGVNNAVLVYDFLQQKWAGADTGSSLCVQEWVKATYQGVRRLFALSADGYINLYEEMPYDEVGRQSFSDNILPDDATYGAGGSYSVAVTQGSLYAFTLGTFEAAVVNGADILVSSGSLIAHTNTLRFLGQGSGPPVSATLQLATFSLGVEWIGFDNTSRGYTCQTLGRKRWIRLVLELETWFPEFSVYAITEGATEEVAVVTDKTKSFLKYDRPWNAANWDPTNNNNDHATKWRQDYAIVLGDTTTASGSIQAGVKYFVEDVNEAASITYNGNVITAPAIFTGVAGVTTFTVTSGTPLVYAPGNYFNPGSAGVNPDQTQESTEKLRFPLAVRGKQVQIRVVSSRGRVNVLSIGVEGILADKQMGAQV